MLLRNYCRPVGRSVRSPYLKRHRVAITSLERVGDRFGPKPISRAMIPKLSILLLMSLNVYTSEAQQRRTSKVHVHVDERLELLTTVLHLAGIPGFSKSIIEIYDKDLNRVFQPYKDHAAVAMARRMFSKTTLDTPLILAVHLSQPPNLRLLSFGKDEESMTLSDEDSHAFVHELPNFYGDTQFHSFFVDHSELYSKLDRTFSGTLNTLNIDWFKNIYGGAVNPLFELLIAPELANVSVGPRATSASGRTEFYAIVNCFIPITDVLSVVVHEYNHSYVNPVVAKHLSDFTSADHTSRTYGSATVRRASQPNRGRPAV